jgi:uncharacterized protein YndB with AHSA1/START domain
MSEDVVKRSVVVNAPIEHAFKVFTERFDLWWPREHHIGKADLKTAIIEPKAGGRFYEKGVDGSECEWGTVLEFTPPSRVALAWHLDPSWSYDPNPERASEVEVTFVDRGGEKSRVELTHSKFSRHGDGWEKVRDGVGGERRWRMIIERFAAAAA